MLLFTLALLIGETKPGGYAKPDLLVEPGTLKSEAFRKDVTILDARPRSAYDGGHVPGAVWVDHAGWSKAFSTDREGWSKRIGKLGITTKSTVVVYDDAQAKDSARIWWILRYWGVADVRLLNGGWPLWKSSGLPVSTETSEPAAEVLFEPKANPDRLATMKEVIDALETGQVKIVDTRSEEEF